MNRHESIYDNPLLTTVYDIALVSYIKDNMDMAGVIPVMVARLATACRTSKPKLQTALNGLISNGLAVLSNDKTNLWWESGIYRSLYRGRYSDKQMKSVVKTLIGWDGCGGFPPDFSMTVADIYREKYGITIPLVANGEVGHGGIVTPVKEMRISQPVGYSLDVETLADQITGAIESGQINSPSYFLLEHK